MSAAAHRICLRLLKGLDAIALLLALLGAGIATFLHVMPASWSAYLGATVTVKNLLMVLLLSGVWHVSFDALGLYKADQDPFSSGMLIDAAKGALAATAFLVVVTQLFEFGPANPSFLAGFGALSALGLVTTRLFVAHAVRPALLQGREDYHVLIVGSGPRARLAVSEVKKRVGHRARLLGFVDEEWEGARAMEDAGYEPLGGFADFPKVIHERVVDEVLVCLPIQSQYGRARDVLRYSERMGVAVTIPGDVFDVKRANLSTQMNGGDTLIAYDAAGLGFAGAVAKQLMDVVGSALLLLISSPLFVIIPALIKLDSPGPVFFVQDRQGLNRRVFRIIKFRTMSEGADERIEEFAQLNDEEGPGFKIWDDPRVTRVGRWLRRFSLDELPQLINVLKGDMSLIGPRPLFRFEFSRIDEPDVLRRSSVKPGLTGLWQVEGRNDLTFERRIELDLEYVENWSLWLDIKILFKTVPAVLTGRGAT